jgi:hypothetical protein
MRLPIQKKISREDMKDAPSWVNAIIEPVNNFMNTVYLTLNQNVTYTDNFASFVKEIDYTTPSTYPMGVSNVSFMNNLKVKATGIHLALAVDKSDYTPPPGPVYIPWVEINGSIIIYPVTGLEASRNYLLRLVVY